MTNDKNTIFVRRSYQWMLARIFSNRSHSPLELLIILSAFLWGLCLFYTFVSTAVLYSHTASKLEQVSKIKNEFIKYERGKSLIQREHPSNDQLPSTRQELHSIPNNPAKEHGGFLDRTKSSLLCNNNYLNFSLMGMKVREGMFTSYY